jgi:hypothetical protein
MSIVAGVKYNTRNVKLDYSDCDEDFLPYYPVMTDARRVSAKTEPIICVPTNCFYASRRQVFVHHLGKAVAKIRGRVVGPDAASDNGRTVEVYGEEWAQTGEGFVKRVYEKGIIPYFSGKHTISDLAQLDYPLMIEMLDSIRKRSRASSLTDVPVVLENHTKDLRNFADLERFLQEVVDSSDIKIVTLTELAKGLGQKFKIKTRSVLGDAATSNR